MAKPYDSCHRRQAEINLHLSQIHYSAYTAAMKTYQVYVLVNRGNRRFIAIAQSPKEELEMHNRGEFKWTAQFKPWKIEWQSAPMSRRDADRLECKLVPHKTNPNALHYMCAEYTEDQDPDVFGVDGK